MFVDTYSSSTITRNEMCPSGKFSGSTCATVTVKHLGHLLAYPYYVGVGQSCEYVPSAAQAAITSAHGFCPIVAGMAEYQTYLAEVMTFYKLAEVQSLANFPVTKKLSTNPEDFSNIETTSAATQAALVSLKRHSFNITHTSLLETCSGLLSSSCNREVPSYSHSFDLVCRGECSYRITCGAPTGS